MYQLTTCAVLSSLLRYILTIIRFVASIVVVGRTKSIKVSTGEERSVHPISASLVGIAGPIGVPVESASCIVIYDCIPSLSASLRKCV